MPNGVRVIGLQELGDSVTQFTNKVQRVMIRKAANAGGDVMKKAIAERAPVLTDFERAGKSSSGRKPPGWLKRHIMRRGQATRDGGFKVNVGPSPSAYWGRFAELGTNHQKQQPFIRPGFDASAGAAVDKFTAVLGEQIAAEMGH